jgi:epoxyqueuosine reductase
MKNILNISAEHLLSNKVVTWGYSEELKPKTYPAFLKWIDQNYNGPLKYLEDHRKLKRESLTEVYPECQSAIVFLFDYRDSKKYQMNHEQKHKIASYTIGFEDEDYHVWIRNKLEAFGDKLKEQNPELEYKISLDIHPVLERDLAQRAGLGWFGKNSMIISREFGSYNLIGSLLLNQKFELEQKEIEADHCGTCTRCIDACPTKAIIPGSRTIDSNLCISTFTIELFKDAEPPTGYPVESQEVFGCDICQEVCPWNIKTLKGVEELGESKLVEFFNRDLKDICSEIELMSNKQFKTFFKDTSFERVGKKGLLKNLKYYLI